MEISHTLLLIENQNTVTSDYNQLLKHYFKTIVVAHTQEEALSYYLHYHPDVVILGAAVLNDDYKDFLNKLKKNISVPIIITVRPYDVQKVHEIFDYNFSYCILDKHYKSHLKTCIDQAIQKVSLVKQLIEIDSHGKLINLQKYVNGINRTSIPTIICTGNIDEVRCNTAFTQTFGVSQDEVNQNVITQDFLNRLELKWIIERKDLCQEHTIAINGIRLKAKIYILRQYELYLITFNSMSNENQVINLNLKKELHRMLERFDKNFDDHVKLQYNMFEITSQIRGFLQSNTKDLIIEKWLECNKNVVQNIERELDYVILEELKSHTYLNAS